MAARHASATDRAQSAETRRVTRSQGTASAKTTWEVFGMGVQRRVLTVLAQDSNHWFTFAPLSLAVQAVCFHALQANGAMPVSVGSTAWTKTTSTIILFSCFTGQQSINCEYRFCNLNEDSLYSLLSFFTGKQCNDCEYGFYNLTEDNPYGCAPCSCSPVGSLSLSCNPLTGQCQCKDNVQGHKCDQCMDGFYNFSMGCLPCNCNVTGTEAGTTCDR